MAKTEKNQPIVRDVDDDSGSVDEELVIVDDERPTEDSDVYVVSADEMDGDTNDVEIVDLCSSPSTSLISSTSAAAAYPEKSGTERKTDPPVSSSIECPICLQTCIHPARLPCGHIFCFLCVKGVAYKNRRCAMCRREIPPEFLDHPQLVNGIQDICTTKTTEDGYQWFYEGRNGWWQYDDRTSQDIEEAYKKGDKSCTILVAGYVYVVDFEGMLQQRQNEPSRRRHVKRDLASIPKKGVAGLRIEGNSVATDSNFALQVYQSRRIDLNSVDDALAVYTRSSPVQINYNIRGISASDFISTIAAPDAAIRIASDIIGSTVAHADEISRSESIAGSSNIRFSSDFNGQSSLSTPALSAVPQGSRELIGVAEDLLDATQSIISEADQQTIDLFEQTLNDFHALTLRNIIDSTVSDGEDDDEQILL